MSNLKFSKGKFSKFISSKGFYVAIAVCLVGAGVATWLAVDRTISGIEDNNNQVIESENQWNDFPELEEAETKQSGVGLDRTTPESKSSQSSSSSSSASSSSKPSEPVSEPSGESGQLEVQVTLPSLAYALPIRSEIIQSFSDGELVKNITLNDWRTHDGIDIAAEKGTDVMAAADGTVAEVKSDALWGTMVTISHADGNETVYCGLDNDVAVAEGDTVLARQVIGKVEGVPSEISLPSHLHFAIRNDGKWIDPISVLQKALVDDED